MIPAEVARVPRLVKHYVRAAVLRRGPVVWDLNVVMTNRCNQACPMCNAGVLSQQQAQVMTIQAFRRYMDMLSDMEILVGTISGGEPTLAPDLPEILTEAARFFRERVMLISNFYTRGRVFERAMTAALTNDVHVTCSFDGFGAVADRLRGRKNVADTVIRNIEIVQQMKRRLKSRSTLEIHTVMSDDNLGQTDAILELSQRLGWAQTVAPVNSPAQQPRPPDGIGLTDSQDLARAVDRIPQAPNVRQLRAYIAGIPAYARGQHRQYCPYLTRGFETLKVFLEPNGDISLCTRNPIGNLNTNSLDEILRGKAYHDFLGDAENCPGCWLSCFTEPVLGLHISNLPDAFVKRVFPRSIRATCPQADADVRL